jgi:hypothetical protein
MTATKSLWQGGIFRSYGEQRRQKVQANDEAILLDLILFCKRKTAHREERVRARQSCLKQRGSREGMKKHSDK